MSGARGATGPTGAGGDAEAFARLLRGLKERSGLSYGALAQRLHMSTSTLHRYCNGSAVPADYAPVERLARLCRASPEELVELHRRWILADAARGRKGPVPEGAAKPGVAQPGAAQPPPETERAGPEDGPPDRPSGTEPAPAVGARREPAGGEAPVVGAAAAPATSVRPPRRRRTALIAATAAAAVLGAVVLAVSLPSSGDDGREQRAAGPSGNAKGGGTSSGPANDKRPSASQTPTPSRSAKSGAPSASSPESGAPDGGEADQPAGGSPVNVAARPYSYEGPCSQHFLVDDEPEQIGPPANEPDAPRWAAAYGAVSSGEQRVALTLQGAGKETVVLEALHVRVVTKSAPLAWNDYAMGSGCGGNVSTKSFDIDLDNGSPTVSAKNGQRDFPYKVSESDPEVFYVTARTKAHDVRWDLTLEWSSGDRRGTVHIDNKRTPFRTSGDTGRPSYHYPLGGSEWIERLEQ